MYLKCFVLFNQEDSGYRKCEKMNLDRSFLIETTSIFFQAIVKLRHIEISSSYITRSLIMSVKICIKQN